MVILLTCRAGVRRLSAWRPGWRGSAAGPGRHARPTGAPQPGGAGTGGWGRRVPGDVGADGPASLGGQANCRPGSRCARSSSTRTATAIANARLVPARSTHIAYAPLSALNFAELLGYGAARP